MEVIILLDTNRYTDLIRGDSTVQAILLSVDEIWLPFIVMAELSAGFRAGNRIGENERVLAKFLAQPGVRIVYADAATVNTYAELYVQLRRQGTPIPEHDIWIAALAVQHRVPLFSRDAHFDHLPQVQRL